MKAKIQRSHDVLIRLAERYDIEKQARRVKRESLRLSEAKTINKIRNVEGRAAQYYWEAVQAVIPETFCFQSRLVKSHQYNATDPVNLCLNYAYGVIEGEVRRAINTVGLEPAVGFLHESAGYQTKESLVYDLQEPFRWLGDVATIEAFKSGVLDMKDFYFTGDDYRYRIEVDAKRRFLELLKAKFNAGVKYKGKTWKWDTVILGKTQELARHLLGRKGGIEFAEPTPQFAAASPHELRKKVLTLTVPEARKIGINRSTLRHVRMRAISNRPLRMYQRTKDLLYAPGDS